MERSFQNPCQAIGSDRKPLSPVQAADAETRRLLIELGGEALG